MTQLIALVAAVLSLSGIVVGLVGIVGTTRPPGPPSALRLWLGGVWSGHGRNGLRQRTRQTMLIVAVLMGATVWLVSAIPIAGLIAGLAVVGIPWLILSGTEEKKAIAKLGALETWTRRLADIVANGLGLQAAVVATAATPPLLIEREVRTLAARLQAGSDAESALRGFADDIDDYTGDQVVAPLILHAADRGDGLANVLTDISRSIAAEIEMRSTIDAKRASPRFAVRFLTGMTVALLLYGAFNATYLAPYATVSGQIILVILAGIYVALMAWGRRLSSPERRGRLLAPLEGGPRVVMVIR
jgi:Flp pilus assembly protein TadB